MSYDIYFSIRGNVKTRHKVSTLFFGEQWVYDFPKVFDTDIFESYTDCLSFIKEHKLIDVHIRKHVSTSGCCYYKDYVRLFKGRRKYQ